MSKDSNLKFFCENCGKEVRRNAGICPHCGRLFASVKCPSCNYAGSESQFRNGCPRCGYALRPNSKNKDCVKKDISYSKKKYDDSLPFWLYASVLCFFIVLVAIVLFH